MSAGGERIGLFGGTFDPVHASHLDLARAARGAAGLTEVRFLVNQRSPHKGQAAASGIHRHAMVALATAGEEAFIADPREVEQAGPSYTVDTVERFRQERPEAELYLLLGADSLRDVLAWQRWADLVRQVRLVIVKRSGSAATELLAALPAEARGEAPLMVPHVPPAWSSSALRAVLRDGQAPPDGALAPPVAEYARKHRLYTSSACGGEGSHG